MAASSEEFYRIQKLPPYVFAVLNEKCAHARTAGIDVIDLGMGNPDGPTPRPVVKRLVKEARHARNHRYSASRGIEVLRQQIVRRYRANYDVELDPDHEAIVTIGAKEGLAHLMLAVLAPGDAVVSANPAYPIHQFGVVLAEGHACMLPMPDAPTFLDRLRNLYRTSDRKPKFILISFPHNPTTICVDLDFLREVVQIAREYDAYVIHDFAYADLGFDGYKPPSILQVEGAKDVAVEMFSMSKSYNMAGWRIGFCVGNPRLIAALTRMKSYLDYGVFQPIQLAAATALEQCEEDTRKICTTYQKRRDALVKGLNKAGWKVEPPRGTMFLWAAIPDRFRELGSVEFSMRLLDKARVAVSPGVGFGPMGEGHVRFSLIEGGPRLQEAAARVGEFLKAED